MIIFELLKIGIRNLLAHKLRSFLSVLGVVFGVAAVIAMISIGEGARREALEQIRLLGTNNIIVRALSLSQEERLEARKNLSKGLTLTDAFRIRDISPIVDKVFALEESLEEARYEDREARIHLVGTTPDYLSVFGIEMAEGRFLALPDLENQAKVSVLGWEKYRELFPSGGGLGKYISIKSQLYKVVGVIANRDLPKKENPVVQVRNINHDVYIPINQTLIGSSTEANVDEIMIHVRDADFVI
ncbi:MAG TPA: ABC transporter permease, partial [Nitrospiria bacterium]